MAQEIVRNFDEEWAAEDALRDDRTVVIGGETLILARDIHPSVLAELEHLGSEGQRVAQLRDAGEPIPDGVLDDVFERYGAIARECFAPESRDVWQQVATRRGEGEVGWYRMQDLVPWLVGQIGERPFVSASTSGATPAPAPSETASTGFSASPPAGASMKPRLTSARSST